MVGSNGDGWAVGIALMVAIGLVTVTAPSALAGHAYDQAVWFNWETTELDVRVVGIGDPLIGHAIEDAIDAWRTGIHASASGGPLEDVVIRDFIPATDAAPPPGYEADDIEITVIPSGGMAASSLGLEPLPGPLEEPDCIAFAPLPIDPVASPNATYRTIAHEFGHCLGLGHVFDHDTEYAPAEDLMGSGLEARACPSNLNIRVLERVFSGEEGEVSIPASAYSHVPCDPGTPSVAAQAVGTATGPVPSTPLTPSTA